MAVGVVGTPPRRQQMPLMLATTTSSGVLLLPRITTLRKCDRDVPEAHQPASSAPLSLDLLRPWQRSCEPASRSLQVSGHRRLRPAFRR